LTEATASDRQNRAHRQLDPVGFIAALAEGPAMILEQAIEYALASEVNADRSRLCDEMSA